MPDKTPAEELRGKAKDIRDDMGDIARIVKDASLQIVEDVRSATREKVAEGKSRASGMEDRFEERVRENPVRSVLIASGIGFLLGVLWRR